MSQIYETEKSLGEYLLFHYASSEEILTNDRDWPDGMVQALGFPVRTVGHFEATQVARGLDVGCAVGRSTFEMSRHCDFVTGIDFSTAFVTAAEQMRTRGEIIYRRCDEGMLNSDLTARIPAGIEPARCSFEQGDAMDLSPLLGSFDRVHAANLICRLSHPALFLRRLSELVKSGGQLVMATPCTWLEEFTPKPEWPSGSTLDWLKSCLLSSFHLESQVEEAFLIRETARKFQWTLSLTTVWRRH